MVGRLNVGFDEHLAPNRDKAGQYLGGNLPERFLVGFGSVHPDEADASKRCTVNRVTVYDPGYVAWLGQTNGFYWTITNHRSGWCGRRCTWQRTRVVMGDFPSLASPDKHHGHRATGSRLDRRPEGPIRREVSNRPIGSYRRNGYTRRL